MVSFSGTRESGLKRFSLLMGLRLLLADLGGGFISKCDLAVIGLINEKSLTFRYTQTVCRTPFFVLNKNRDHQLNEELRNFQLFLFLRSKVSSIFLRVFICFRCYTCFTTGFMFWRMRV